MRRQLRLSLVASSVACALAPFPSIMPGALASEIGQEIADQISAASFQQILDNELYTHLGHNKGVNGAEHDLCRDAIRARFESYGLNVELDPFLYLGGTYHNVVATQPGTKFPDQVYVIGAHYDSVNNPGADDDASGVAAILEIARILAQYQFDYTIKYIAWDREEQGKIGSTAYVAEHMGTDWQAMVQLDMIAHDVGLNQENMWGDAGSAPLRTNLVAAAQEYGDGLTFSYAGPATFSDHAPFAAVGVQAMVFVEHNYQQFGCYHQPCDAIETPNYIHYDFAANLARVVAGYLADHAGASPISEPTDLSGDGQVNAADLALLLGAWGPCAPNELNCYAADFNNDDAVNAADLAILLGAWG